ncbi:SixA phosphatase family protein [Neorhizobium sp. NPDC001467]|uniref:SixA phosphatase family protein n=1 Tax=Neorhizobium sp. NPDC001467 TaxID=3390595 RepID=UPI003D05E64A
MTTIQPPPSRIFLLRHGHAAQAQSGQRDFDRELDDRGYGEAELVCEKAVDKGYRPDLILSSTAPRCRQTADAMHRAMAGECILQPVDEIYNGTVETYLALLAGQAPSPAVMLVGHNPSIAETLERLVGHEQARSAVPGGYPTAGLAILDHDGEAWIMRDFIHA